MPTLLYDAKEHTHTYIPVTRLPGLEKNTQAQLSALRAIKIILGIYINHYQCIVAEARGA